jgi:hypothetical protein
MVLHFELRLVDAQFFKERGQIGCVHLIAEVRLGLQQRLRLFPELAPFWVRFFHR